LIHQFRVLRIGQITATAEDRTRLVNAVDLGTGWHVEGASTCSDATDHVVTWFLGRIVTSREAGHATAIGSNATGNIELDLVGAANITTEAESGFWVRILPRWHRDALGEVGHATGQTWLTDIATAALDIVNRAREEHVLIIETDKLAERVRLGWALALGRDGVQVNAYFVEHGSAAS